jgi:hypothetical protein
MKKKLKMNNQKTTVQVPVQNRKLVIKQLKVTNNNNKNNKMTNTNY